MKGPLVAAFRSPLMKALDRSVETLGLWIVTSSVTFIKSVNQSSIRPCLSFLLYMVVYDMYICVPSFFNEKNFTISFVELMPGRSRLHTNQELVSLFFSVDEKTFSPLLFWDFSLLITLFLFLNNMQMWSIANSTIIHVVISKLTPIHIQRRINFQHFYEMNSSQNNVYVTNMTPIEFY